MHPLSTALKLLFILIMMGINCKVAFAAEQTVGPLDRPISGDWSYNSFDDVIQQIEQNTGFKVSCPNELTHFMQTIWMKGSFSKGEANTTVRMFLDRMGGLFNLGWDYDVNTNTVRLKMAWKTNDPRPASELLKAVWQPGYGTDFEKDPKWQNAFDGLLSTDTNFEKAWKVRQKSNLQGIRLFANASSKPILRDELLDASGNKYVVLMICQPIQMTPGHGSVSYYLFKEDGTLVDADLIDSGWRCTFIDAAVDNEYSTPSDRGSELQMILKFNDRDFMLARLVLDATHLKLTHLTDTHGNERSNDGIRVGQTLMQPDKQ